MRPAGRWRGGGDSIAQPVTRGKNGPRQRRDGGCGRLAGRSFVQAGYFKMDIH